MPGLTITDVRHLKACPVGLACFHPVVPSKRQMPDRKNGSGLKLFIDGGECVGLQIPIASLFQHVGHRHERIGIFPRVLHLSAQGTDLLFDLHVIFSGGTFALGWSDQTLGEKRQNGLEDLLAAGLGTQDAASRFHFTSLLSITVSTAREEMTLDLLPGWPRPITCKKVKALPHLLDNLINSDTAGIK